MVEELRRPFRLVQQRVTRAVRIAKGMGLTVSCDLNYRHSLWQWGKRPSEVMPLVEQCDILIGNMAELMLGMEPVFRFRPLSRRKKCAGNWRIVFPT
ncbi:MAG: hypothetical protein H6658_18630 [Ardenticatenaceae bacterium]|nr:hypothetical protein [Ardenticatenaceae bacterium]